MKAFVLDLAALGLTTVVGWAIVFVLVTPILRRSLGAGATISATAEKDERRPKPPPSPRDKLARVNGSVSDRT